MFLAVGLVGFNISPQKLDKQMTIHSISKQKTKMARKNYFFINISQKVSKGNYLFQCPHKIKKLRDALQEREGTSLNY